MSNSLKFYTQNIRSFLEKYFQSEPLSLKNIEDDPVVVENSLSDKIVLFEYQSNSKTKRAALLLLEATRSFTSLQKIMNIVSLFNHLKLDYLLVVSRYSFNDEIKNYLSSYFPEKIHLLEADFLQKRFYDDEVKTIDPNYRDVKSIVIRNDLVDFFEDLSYEEMKEVKKIFDAGNEQLNISFNLLDKQGNNLVLTDYEIQFLKELDKNKDIKYGMINLENEEVFISLPSGTKKRIKQIYVFYFITYGLNLEECFVSLFVNLLTSSISYDYIVNRDFRVIAPRYKFDQISQDGKKTYDQFLSEKVNSLHKDYLNHKGLNATNKEILLKNFKEVKNIYDGSRKIKDNFATILTLLDTTDNGLKNQLLSTDNDDFNSSLRDILENVHMKKKLGLSKTSVKIEKKIKSVAKAATKKVAEATTAVKKSMKDASEKIKMETKKVVKAAKTTAKPLIKKAISVEKSLEQMLIEATGPKKAPTKATKTTAKKTTSTTKKAASTATKKTTTTKKPAASTTKAKPAAKVAGKATATKTKTPAKKTSSTASKAAAKK